MENWEFFTQRVSGADYTAWRWKWRRVSADGTVVESAETFPTLTLCVRDARKNGYSGKDPTGGGSVIYKPHYRHV